MYNHASFEVGSYTLSRVQCLRSQRQTDEEQLGDLHLLWKIPWRSRENSCTASRGEFSHGLVFTMGFSNRSVFRQGFTDFPDARLLPLLFIHDATTVNAMSSRPKIIKSHTRSWPEISHSKMGPSTKVDILLWFCLNLFLTGYGPYTMCIHWWLLIVIIVVTAYL